ncbi:hypothetical protein ABIB68_004811 [Bradyrhizobium sp. F1.2.2]
MRKLKSDQQFIFATHNANFPGLGDSETVAACDASETAIDVVSGSIDTKDVQGKVVKIMRVASKRSKAKGPDLEGRIARQNFRH